MAPAIRQLQSTVLLGWVHGRVVTAVKVQQQLRVALPEDSNRCPNQDHQLEQGLQGMASHLLQASTVHQQIVTQYKPPCSYDLMVMRLLHMVYNSTTRPSLIVDVLASPIIIAVLVVILVFAIVALEQRSKERVVVLFDRLQQAPR